jgi:hypothetical protein
LRDSSFLFSKTFPEPSQGFSSSLHSDIIGSNDVSASSSSWICAGRTYLPQGHRPLADIHAVRYPS